MRVVGSRDEVRAQLRRHPERHLLATGDLDDAFWPQTRFLHRSGQTLMIYTGLQGTRTWSAAERVAVLGNIATHLTIASRDWPPRSRPLSAPSWPSRRI